MPIMFRLDGMIDCIDGGEDGSNSPDCMDSSDEPTTEVFKPKFCERIDETLTPCSDISCQFVSEPSSFIYSRQYLLIEAMHPSNDSSASEKC